MVQLKAPQGLQPNKKAGDNALGDWLIAQIQKLIPKEAKAGTKSERVVLLLSGA